MASLSYSVVCVPTPLDALATLSGDAHVVAIVVAGGQQHGDGLGLLESVKNAYPGVRGIARA